VHPVRYEQHFILKSKSITVTGRGGRGCVSCEVRTSPYKKVKLSP
jgi:hypothetical protein